MIIKLVHILSKEIRDVPAEEPVFDEIEQQHLAFPVIMKQGPAICRALLHAAR